MGSFCPRTSVLRPSMADTPVCMKSRGYSLAIGFMGTPLIFIRRVAKGFGLSSMGSPRPLNTRPIISRDTSSSRGRPANRTLVDAIDNPRVPPKAWIIAISSVTSSTLPIRVFPPGSVISTISSNPTPLTPSTITMGPEMCDRPIYSFPCIICTSPPGYPSDRLCLLADHQTRQLYRQVFWFSSA